MRKTKSRSRALPEKPQVLVIETGSIGELLVTTPALRALRKAYPKSRVTAIVSPRSAPALVGNPNVDRLLPLEEKHRSGAIRVTMLSTWINAQRFDLALVFHTSFGSALLAAMGRVPRRAGLSCRGRGFLLTDAAQSDSAAYDVDDRLRVLSLLGVEPDGRELELHLTAEERSEGRELLGREGGPVVALHPGAGGGKLRWPFERFAELGARLQEQRGIRPVYLVDPEDGDAGSAIAEWWRSHGKSEPLVVKPRSMRILGGAFATADAVVTNSAGPIHVAAAVRAPSVFIHGPAPVARRHPPGDRYVAIAADVPCRPCDSPACSAGSIECMEEVSVDGVFEAVTRLVGGGAS